MGLDRLALLQSTDPDPAYSEGHDLFGEQLFLELKATRRPDNKSSDRSSICSPSVLVPSVIAAYAANGEAIAEYAGIRELVRTEAPQLFHDAGGLVRRVWVEGHLLEHQSGS